MNKEKGRIGFTAGNFDLLHPGYIYTFETAKEHCDYFMVFLQRDPSLHRKSKYKPVIPLYERYKTLMAIKYIDEVVTYQTEEELLNLIEFYKPNLRILGDDYIGKRFTGDHLPIEVFIQRELITGQLQELKILSQNRPLNKTQIYLKAKRNEHKAI